MALPTQDADAGISSRTLTSMWPDCRGGCTSRPNVVDEWDLRPWPAGHSVPMQLFGVKSQALSASGRVDLSAGEVDPDRGRRPAATSTIPITQPARLTIKQRSRGNNGTVAPMVFRLIASGGFVGFAFVAAAACSTDAKVECRRDCTEAHPRSIAELQRRLECSCVATAFCRSECQAQPFCATPPAEVTTACQECLLGNMDTNCGSVSLDCVHDAACIDGYRCLENCSGS